MNSSTPFPLNGIIGVVANSTAELVTAAEFKLQCVELRADLLLDSGMSLEAVLATIQQAKSLNLATLFTLRHPTHGGKFTGTEADRVNINQQALQAGADIIDLEWGTEAATEMLKHNSPLILSYHDFNGMPTEVELAELTSAMESGGPTAIKVVPTASSLGDSVRMLQWVAQASDKVIRIGFAMGPNGACSRILTIAHGAPITYASFGEAVAPGQVAIEALINNYRAMSLNENTTLVAVTGDEGVAATEVEAINKQLPVSNQVAIEFSSTQKDELQTHREALRITATRTV